METILDTINPGDLQKAETSVPLAIDLDGTLVRADLLIESLMVLVKCNPLYVLRFPLWALKGKAHLKRQASRRATLDVSSLPYHLELLTYLRNQREQGRRLILAKAADEHIAHQISNYLQLFEGVMASDGAINLAGVCKKKRLIDELGEKGFDYAGNDRRDLAVWKAAHRGEMHNDPLVFALKNRVSQIIVAIMAAIMIVAI